MERVEGKWKQHEKDEWRKSFILCIPYDLYDL